MYFEVYVPKLTKQEIHAFYPDLEDDARKVKRYEEKHNNNKKSGRGKQKIESPWTNPLNSNNTIPSGGWSNTEGQVAEVRFTGDQSIQKRQSRSMEEALQNEISKMHVMRVPSGPRWRSNALCTQIKELIPLTSTTGILPWRPTVAPGETHKGHKTRFSDL